MEGGSPNPAEQQNVPRWLKRKDFRNISDKDLHLYALVQPLPLHASFLTLTRHPQKLQVDPNLSREQIIDGIFLDRNRVPALHKLPVENHNSGRSAKEKTNRERFLADSARGVARHNSNGEATRSASEPPVPSARRENESSSGSFSGLFSNLKSLIRGKRGASEPPGNLPIPPAQISFNVEGDGEIPSANHTNSAVPVASDSHAGTTGPDNGSELPYSLESLDGRDPHWPRKMLKKLAREEAAIAAQAEAAQKELAQAQLEYDMMLADEEEEERRLNDVISVMSATASSEIQSVLVVARGRAATDSLRASGEDVEPYEIGDEEKVDDESGPMFVAFYVIHLFSDYLFQR